jgi:CheY-like chemotaxis protein
MVAVTKNATLAGKPSILIVDDEFGLAEMLGYLLNELGYTVRVAMDGRSALATLHGEPIDIVLTDLMMPVMDGSELVRAIRAEPTFDRIPVILMTAVPSAARRDSDLYDGILKKPFTAELLVTVFDHALSRRTGRDNPHR